MSRYVMMKAHFIAVLFVVSTAGATTFQNCDGVNPPTEVRVKDCEEPPCKLYHGGKLIAEVDFTADHQIKNMRPELIATVYGVEIEYPVAEQDACKSLINAECPLEKGDKVTYLLDIDILPSYPKIKATMQLSLKDADNGQATTCFRIEAEIV